jgi:hypothetical protein
MTHLTTAITGLAVSYDTLATSVIVTNVAEKSIFIVDLTSANTASRHNNLLNLNIISIAQRSLYIHVNNTERVQNNWLILANYFTKNSKFSTKLR